MKLQKKIFFIFLLLIVLLSTSVLAATTSSEKAKFEIVENNICTINITDTAVFEKKIVDYDLEKKELTIGLKVTNNAIAPLDKPSEIVLVIDDSRSMKETIATGGMRMEAVTDSAKILATELLKLDTVKLSVVSFSTGENRGDITDAKLRTGLTNSKDAVLGAIDNITNDFFELIEENDPNSPIGITTDIEAGITLASQQFSGTCESKFIILLTDGVPNVSLGSDRILYSGVTATNTKNALTRIGNTGIEILSMMTGVTNSVETQTGKTYKTLAEEVFGTPEDPTVGKFYYITDTEIEQTISETILTQLVAPEDDILTDIDIYDYFPQEIVDNFNFEYVDAPSMGTISEDIDLQNNLIKWHIDRLSYGETATVSYKLTLKDEINEDIVGVILDTNEKVDITTDKVLDDTGAKKVLTSDVTPKVKVTIPEEPTPEPEPEPEKPKDDTVAPDPIPQTGATIIGAVILVICVIACVVIGIRLYVKGKDIK